MSDKNTSSTGSATAQKKAYGPSEGEVAERSRVAASQQAFRRLLEANKLGPENAYGIESTPAIPATKSMVPKENAGALKTTRKVLDKVEDFVTSNTIAKVKKIGVAGAGAALIYQAVDNAGEAITGKRTVPDAVTGIITDITGNWRDIVHVAGQVVSHPVFYLSTSLGVLFFWGRKALKKFIGALKEAAKLTYKSERIVDYASKFVDFAKSLSKISFVALALYHSPNLVKAGTDLFTFSNASSGWSQLSEVISNFFRVAPLTVYAVFGWLSCVVASELIIPPIKALVSMANEKKKKEDEEKRVKAENEANNKLTELANQDLTPDEAINAYDAEAAILKASEENRVDPRHVKSLMQRGLSLDQAIKFLKGQAEAAPAPAPDTEGAEEKKAGEKPPDPSTTLTPPTQDEKAAEEGNTEAPKQ